MTTIKHAGVPVAVVPASSTRDMEEEIAYYRYDYVTEASDIFDKVLAAAPSEPGADLVELIGALRGLLDMNVESAKGLGLAPERLRGVARARAALAKWIADQKP